MYEKAHDRAARRRRDAEAAVRVDAAPLAPPLAPLGHRAPSRTGSAATARRNGHGAARENVREDVEAADSEEDVRRLERATGMGPEPDRDRAVRANERTETLRAPDGAAGGTAAPGADAAAPGATGGGPDAARPFDERFGDGPMASRNPIAAGTAEMSPMQAGLQRFAEAHDPRFRGRQQALREGGYLDAIPRALTTGVVGNLPDYGPALAEGMQGIVDGRGFSRAMDEELEVQRGQREGLEQKFPMTTTAGNLTGAVAPAVATAGLAAGPNVLVRGAKAARVGGTLGFAQNWAQGEGAADRLEEGLKGAAWGAALGPVGEAVTTGAGALVSKALGGARIPAPGVDPLQAVRDASEFGIPLTRGQALGDIGQQAWEEAARHNARGDLAGRTVRGFDERQAQAVQAAKGALSEGFGGPAPSSLAEGGEAVALGLRDKADELRRAAGAAYEAAAGKQATVAIDEVGRLDRAVAGRLDERGIVLDPYGNHPGAQSAMELLRRVSGREGAPAGETVVAQSLLGLEQTRKALLKVRPANAEDYRALKEIRSAYDGWIGDAIDRKLFSGDASALDDLKNGRELWARYKGLTNGKKGDALPLVSKMMDEGRTGEEVANWLTGAASAGQAGRAARVAVEIRRALGAESREWQILRQTAWMKAANPAQEAGNGALAASVSGFASGPLARQLFSAEELGRMRRFAATVRRTATDPRATESGGSGYEIGRMLGGALPQLGLGAAGVGGAYATGDSRFLALAAIPLFGNLSAASKARAATKALPGTMGPGAAELARALTFSVSPAMGTQSR